MDQFFYTRPGARAMSVSLNPFSTITMPGDASLSNANLWDQAHALKRGTPEKYAYIEPNVLTTHPSGVSTAGKPDDEYDDFWPYPKNLSGSMHKMIWHLSPAYSQLKKAWPTSGNKKVVRIVHFDTGYDPDHSTYPKDCIETTLERNYVEDNRSAEDIGSDGWLNQPGHGTGTLSILAGAKVQLAEYDNYDDYLGIHQQIKIVPIRISRSVILWKNAAFADALDYIISLYDDPQTRCHIVTMSMGGLPSKRWADAVNRAYEKGIFIVSAAGNNFGRLTPNKLVYPARFNRVVAACGVTEIGLCTFGEHLETLANLLS